MSNWDSETNDKITMNSDNKWRVIVKSIEDNLRKLKQEADDTYQKFVWVKANHGSYETFQNWIHKMTSSCDEITKNMNELSKIIPQKHEMEFTAKNTQLKTLSQRLETQIKHIQKLSSEIQKEMERNYMEKKMAASFISDQSGGAGDARASTESRGSYQMRTLEDPQLQQALEEQRQCEKIEQDTQKLQEMFQQVSELVAEQGEKVEAIHANVEEALDNTTAAQEQLRQAESHWLAANKKKLILICVVVAVVALLILIIALSVKYG